MSKKFAMAFFSCAMLMPSLKGNIFESITNHDIKSLASLTNRMAIVNSRNEKGETPLMVAARLGDVEIVKILISAGAEIEARDHGFSVKDQIDSYLRRTGEARAQIVSFLRKDGFSEKTIRAFEAESDKLQGTPDRIKAWKDILLILSQKSGKAKKPVEPLSFEWTLSVWTETLSWTEDKGFHLTFRSWNKPSLGIQRDDGSYAYINPVGVGIYLQKGKRYMLTNGRGRSQFFKVCSLPLKEPGFDVPPMFPTEHEVLTFEHEEQISRDGKTRHERYVVSPEGDVYDCEAQSQTKRTMPMILPNPWTPPDIQARQNVREVADWNLNLARETLDAARKELEQLKRRTPLIENETNTVCYSTAGRFGAEELRKMTKDGKLSPFLENLVSQFDPERSRVGKWVQLYVEKGVMRIVGLTERFGDGSRRQFWFYPSEAVNLVIDEFTGRKMTIVYHYDTEGNWVWQIKMRDNKAFKFWRVENGRVDESSDLELAQRLAERATIEDVE